MVPGGFRLGSGRFRVGSGWFRLGSGRFRQVPAGSGWVPRFTYTHLLVRRGLTIGESLFTLFASLTYAYHYLIKLIK